MRFRIELTNPRAGWIDVAFALGDDSFGFAASAVLNDPIRELAEIGVFLARGDHGRVAATFWLEPAGYELAVTRGDEYRLAWSYAHEARPHLVRPQLVHECVLAAPHAIAAEIARSLRDAHPLLEASWRHPYPLATVTELAGLLAARPRT